MTRTPAEASEWDALFARVAARLAKGTLHEEAANRVLRMSGLPAVR